MEHIKMELTALLQDTVANISITDEQDYDRPLKELGVDSLDMMSILLEIFDRYKVDILDEEAEKLTTINLIVDHINKELEKMNQVK
jgi:acyl carrier protein